MRLGLPISPSQAGFGLIELMVTIAIATILMLWVMPSFSVWTANARIRSVAEALQNDLRIAQAAALSQDRAISLVLVDEEPVAANVGSPASASSARWLIRRAAAPFSESDFLGGFSIAGDGGDLRVVPLPLLGGTGEVKFNALGRVVASGPIGFSVSSSSNDPSHRPLRVMVSPGGNVRMCDPDARLGPSDSRRC